ncbi:MAG: bifunctional DNA-formamidopyrimidine glycosylase/DNA-(apurinic or apyrimidinic site) lyase [Candidatus Cloacimonadota bacterium]|nr:bifunctional DNA-formamidopyrimidine glycosylase/DNA-(apurinic or apyrimidinic site) lyase [Candidatus Cloacimonadota bacterium]
MPELPEVQTIVSGLKSKILNKKIESLIELRDGTVRFHSVIKQVEFGVVDYIHRKGKYIIFETSNDFKLVIHLRMSGKLILAEPFKELPSHTRAYFVFQDKSKLIFDDVRAFGKIDVYEKNISVPALENLGPDPFVNEDQFTPRYLRSIFKNRKSPIKSVLLNQKVIAGIGNIYACEILFHAGISPLESAKNLSADEIANLHSQIMKVLREAILQNGTTISDYKKIDNKTGNFQNFLMVYQKKQCECGAKIIKIKQAGRSTYYCEACQQLSRSAAQHVSRSAGYSLTC